MTSSGTNRTIHNTGSEAQRGRILLVGFFRGCLDRRNKDVGTGRSTGDPLLEKERRRRLRLASDMVKLVFEKNSLFGEIKWTVRSEKETKKGKVRLGRKNGEPNRKETKV